MTSTLSQITPGEWIQIARTMILAGAAIFWTLGKRWLRERSRNRTFSIDFPGDLYPPTGRTGFPKSATFSIGRAQTVYVRVGVNHSLHLDHWNVRFVKTAKGGDVPTDIMMIRTAYDARRQGYAGGRETKDVRDGKGGVTVEYYPTPKPVAEGEDFWVGVQFHAHQAWKGYLSFEGYDREGHRRWERAEVTVVPSIPCGEDSQAESVSESSP